MSNGGFIGAGLIRIGGSSGIWNTNDQYRYNKIGFWAGSLYARYIRYTPTATLNGSSGGIALADFHVYDGHDATGLDYSRSGATVSANYSYSGYSPTNAIDTNLNSMWWGLSGTVGSVWWQINLGQVRVIRSISFQWFSTYFPTQYNISYSDDGTNFNMITSYSNSDDALKVYNVGV